MSQADGENLVRPNRTVFLITVDDVKQTVRFLVPEQMVEALTSVAGKLAEKGLRPAIAKPARELFHGAQSVVPESLNLNGFAMPRRDDPVSYFGIHPG